MKRTLATVAVLAAFTAAGWYGWTRIPADRQDDALKSSFAVIYAVVATGFVLGVRGAREAEQAQASDEGGPADPG